jgi:hypothetical protein
MGTVSLPGLLDCYQKAEDGEPKFTLLGRDPVAAGLIRIWAAVRSGNIDDALHNLNELNRKVVPNYQDNPTSSEQIDNALDIADQMDAFRAMKGK